MANKKVSELTEATSVNSADVMPVAQSGASKKVTMSNLISSLLQLVSGSVKGLTSVNDSNSNEVLKFASSANAVNEITITNNATGVAPTITATGNDTNIDVSVSGKGTGAVKLSGLKYPATDGANGDEIYTNGSGVLSFKNKVVGKVSNTGTHTTTHSLGRIPTKITITASTMASYPSSSGRVGSSYAVYYGSISYCTFHTNGSDGNSTFSYGSSVGSYSADNKMIIFLEGNTYFSIGSITSTQFTLTMTLGASTTVNSCHYIYEVE